ncbi:retrovirus-related pol polyprotein from transposon TNT 1-94 [Tanacetum coccineum]
MDLKLLYVRHSRLMDESDKFVAKEVESLDSVHERLTTLVNIMDRNNVRPIPVTINTKFLNCLQQEWSKYVTMCNLNHYVSSTWAKKSLPRIMIFALLAHLNASSSHSHTNSSYSLQSYYVTHPPSVDDYDDEYQGELQGNSQADKLTIAMMLLARAISQKFSTPTNNRLPVSSNIRNQAVVQDGRVDIQTKNASYGGNANKNAGRNRTQGFNAGHYAHECQKPKVCDAKYFREQMLLAMKDGAGSNLSNEENDFMLDTSNGEELEELTAAAMLMARLQPTDENAETVPSYDAKAVSQFVENNGGASEHDLTAHDEYHEIQMLAYNVQHEAENQKRLNNELKKQQDLLQRELETFKDRKTLEDADEVESNEHKMVQIDYEKLNALYETFVPQQEPSAEQTYFSNPSTSDNGYTSKDVPSESPVNDKSPKENILENEIDRLLEASLTSEIQNCVLLSVEQQKHELLKVELEKSASDSRDIQANLLKRIKILENDFQRSQAQSIDFKLKLQHQKDKMDCDVSWKGKLSTLHDENVLLKHQVESTVKEQENIKLEFQKLFNSIKAHGLNLLMTISELKNKLKTIDKGKHVNTKFDKSETLGQLLCVTPFNTNLAIKAKNVSNTKVTSDRSKPVTSQSTPTIEKKQQHNTNVIARGISNSVRRPKSKDNKSKNNVLKNTKSSSTYVLKTTNTVCLDSNKCETKPSNVCQKNACITSSKTVNVVNDGLNIVCISCGLDVFLHSHEKCVTRNALTRKSSVQRALSTSPIAAKSKGLGATSVVAKSRFSAAKTPTATNKVSSVSPLSQKSCQSRILSSYIKNKIATSKKWQKWFEYQQGFNWTSKSKSANSQSNVHKCRTSVKSMTNTLVTTNKWVAKPSTLPSAFVSCNASNPACAVDFRFGNDHFAAIIGYGDYVQGNLVICHVYYVEGLGHNLFSVGQFCDGDLEVAFRSNTCYVWNLEGDDLLTGSRDSNLYTISISKMAASSPVCLMSRATSTKSWLRHRRLSHLNFGTINQLTSHDLVDGLPKFKYHKNHLCSACEQGKSKKASLPSKLVPSTESKLELLHMDLCRPMRVASINGKKYILVIVDDYSRFTWVYFLRTKDEAPDMIIDFVNQVQRNLKDLIMTIRTDNETKFKNEKLRRNRTLVEAARTMLIFSKALEFMWAEAIVTACFTQNRSIVHTRHNKTPYELIRSRKPNVQYFHVFGSLCYPTNDRDDIGKMKPKADIGIFVGYSESSRGFQPGMNCANFNDSSEDSLSVPSTSDLDNLFGPMYKEYYVSCSQEVFDNSAANTLDNDHTSSSSSIVVEQDDDPQIVSSSKEQIDT